VELCYAEIGVRVEEYLCSRKFFELDHADRFSVSDIPERNYRNKGFLKISVKKQDWMRMGVLLREIFYTLFPQCWQLLSVAVDGRWMRDELKGRVDALHFLGQDGNFSEGRNEEAIYIIEDSPMDLGLLEAVGNRMERLFAFMNQYVEWAENNGEFIF